ncbi:MAG: PKD domain-containing protein, partial [Bacteroidales bacterium]
MSLNNSKDLIKSNVIRKPNKLIYSKKYFLIVLLFLLAIFQSNNLFGSAPNADFSVDNTTPVVDETVEFTVDLEGADTWNWNFGDGAVPATADTQGPHDVSYSTPGLKTVFLTASNGNSNDTETKENYIRVFENYYFTGDGDPANTTSWNTEPDGTGEAPTNITGDCLNFIIQNGHTMTTTGTWTLGEYSSIQIEDGVLNEDHAISIDPTGSLQVDDDGRLNHNVNSLSIFTGTETLADNSAINYGDNGEQDIADLNYGNLILSGEATKTLQGDVTVANDLTIENNTTLNTGNNTLSADAAQSTASFSMGDGAEFNVEGAFVSSYDYNNINLDDNSTVSYLDADQAVASAPYGNLVIDGGGTIQGDVRVNTSLNLVDGNLATGAGTNNITIAPDGTISENGGFSETRMIECDGEGNLIKEGDNLSDLEMVYPVGSGGTYSPVEVNSLSGTING